MLDQRTIDIIQSTVPVLEQHGVAITTAFYRNMFEDHPELLNIFNHTNQERGRQQLALANMVLAAAKHIDNLEAVLPAAVPVAHKHRSLTVKPEHYPIVGKYLLIGIQEVLGETATPDIMDAWEKAYGVIADVFIGAESGLYEEAKKENGWDDFLPLVLVKKEKESDLITSFYFEREDGRPLPSYKPGQYVTIRFMIDGDDYLSNRQYTLSQAPNEKTFRLSVKREGHVSTALHDDVHIGDRIDFTVPAGTFTCETTDRPIVFVAGGIGVTPLLAMAESLARTTYDRPVTFLQAAKNKKVHAFEQEARAFMEALPNGTYDVLYSEPTNEPNGRWNETTLQPYVDPNADYYICGPVSFMDDLMNILRQAGVPNDQLHFEYFGPALTLEA